MAGKLRVEQSVDGMLEVFDGEDFALNADAAVVKEVLVALLPANLWGDAVSNALAALLLVSERDERVDAHYYGPEAVEAKAERRQALIRQMIKAYRKSITVK